MERAKTILTETLFSKNSNGQTDLNSLPGGRPFIADSLIYRLTFDPEEGDDNDDNYHHLNDYDEMITDDNNQLESSIDINGGNMINVWSSNWDNNNNNNQHDDQNNNVDTIREPESLTTIFNSSAETIKLNVSSLADEIIDSEMNSLKCLQIQPTERTTIKSTITSSDDHHQGLIVDNDDDDETIDIPNNNHKSKSTGQCPSNERKRLKSLILPSLMRGAINTETSIITVNCPPTRAFLSCCAIS